MKTTVIHIREKRAANYVYVGRPTKWGNPFTHLKGKTKAKFIVSTREEAIAKYEEYLLSRQDLMDSLHELRGKQLGCWCKPRSCHGDILKKYADKL